MFKKFQVSSRNKSRHGTFFNRDLGNEQAVSKIGLKNADVKPQAKRGWHSPETSEYLTPSWWGFELFKWLSYMYMCDRQTERTDRLRGIEKERAWTCSYITKSFASIKVFPVQILPSVVMSPFFFLTSVTADWFGLTTDVEISFLMSVGFFE